MDHADLKNNGIPAGIPESDNSRRSFLKKAALATVTLTGAELFPLQAISTPESTGQEEDIPWYRRLTRWGQTNISERDPAHYDIEWWRKHWKNTRTQGIIVNAGGIVAYYPSRIPLHYQAKFLEGRDLFGDLCKAAHEEGLAVFARMDSNSAHEEFYQAHPDWFTVDADGVPHKTSDRYISCINSPYYSEHITAILKEVVELYHPEGFTDNSWSGHRRNMICYCDYCRRSFHDKTGEELPAAVNWDDMVYRKWIRWSYERRLEIWDMNNRITKSAGGPHCIWSGMNSGSIRGQSWRFRDYKEICERADILMCDSQARNDATGFQRNADTGKLIHGLLGWDKLIPESMAQYQAGRPIFRLSAKPEPEVRMWMIEGIAGGIQPWWHYVNASHEDRRIYEAVVPIMNWHRENEEYLINRRPVATVGVVWSQRNMDFYGRNEAEWMVELPYWGIVQSLIRARIPYIPVHADHLERETERLSVLVLPNLGLMNDSQVSAVKKFAEGGGGILATGESSLYDEWGDRRKDYALGDLFASHLADQRNYPGGSALREREGHTYHTYLRLRPGKHHLLEGPRTGLEPETTGARHSVLKGFESTDILSFGGILEEVRTDPAGKVLLTFIPEFPTHPPEKAWMRKPRTDVAGLVLNDLPDGGRVAFMPADLDRQFGRYNLPDHGNLLENLIRWASKDEIPLAVDGPGLIDCNLYHQSGRLVLHLVNLTSAATWRQPVDEFIPVGPLNVRVRLPEDVPGRTLRFLVSGSNTSASLKKGWCQFTVGSVTDHEVVVLS